GIADVDRTGIAADAGAASSTGSARAVYARATRATPATHAANGRRISRRCCEGSARISCCAARAAERADTATPIPTRATRAAGATPAYRFYEHTSTPLTFSRYPTS